MTDGTSPNPAAKHAAPPQPKPASAAQTAAAHPAPAAKVPLAQASLNDAKALLTSNGLKTAASRRISPGFATKAVLGSAGKVAFTGLGGAAVSAGIAGLSDWRAVNNGTMTVAHARADVTVQAFGGGVSALAGAVAGAELGAAIGTLIPIPIAGTVVGAGIGALAGLAGSTAVGAAFEHWAAKPMTDFLESHLFGGKHAPPSQPPPAPVAPSATPSKPVPPQPTPAKKPTP